MTLRISKRFTTHEFLAAAVAGTFLLAGCGKSPEPAPGKPTVQTAGKGAEKAPDAAAATDVSVGIVPGLAAGKEWTASSALEGWKKSGKIEAFRPDDIFFHTVEEENPWVEIDLGSATKLSQVSIKNRVTCCGEREVPTVIELSADRKSWTEVARQEKPFVVWEPTFPEQSARYVRARAPRKTYFHLAQMGCGAAQSASSPTTSSTK